MSAERQYKPYEEKHKAPKGFGSLCPHPFDVTVAQSLLTRAIEGKGGKLWAASGRWCFCAHATRIEENVWHGFPVIGGEVPENVLQALMKARFIDRHEFRQLRRQRELPEQWP